MPALATSPNATLGAPAPVGTVAVRRSAVSGSRTAAAALPLCRHQRTVRTQSSKDGSNGVSGSGTNLNGTPRPAGLDLTGQLDVTEIASQLLAKDPKTQESIERIQAARLRVAEAQAAREDLQKAMQAEVFEARLQEVQQNQTTSQREAEVEVKKAQAALLEAQAEELEAARFEKKWRDALHEEAEKTESIKAGAIAAVAGTVASLPLTATYGDSPTVALLSTLTVTASSLLLGVVYRYALRQDLGNSQLKGGVVAAFGLVRGLAIADALQSGVDGQVTMDIVAKGALLAGHSVLEFGFAAVALEFALQRGFLKPFGTATMDVE
eukprot:CAMPEP_0177785738 /NCGR_PEP_ID=MMETSP0491_2-20121128/20519_1 /TAXON_ID=63592 /ORGANISM="Tetraselmis chuii, Strain PLY429" /LENGTH=323 /DNA_ID=CAMNT_0019306841 /DNA_START=271 /DNA_END=1242 /DNA_ORIENTATION=+